jgi:hypothetical protein
MMANPTRILLLATLAALCVPPAAAQDGPAPAARPAAAAPVAAKPAPTKPIAAEPVPPRVDATFRLWDGDRNGVLSLQEFRTGWIALRREGVRESRQRAQFDKVDANDNGAIDAGEYQNLLLVERAGKAAPALVAFDANRNGRLEFVEYQDMIRRLGPRNTPRQPAASTAGTPASKGNTK